MDIWQWHQTVVHPSLAVILFESEVKFLTHRLSVFESSLLNPYRERPCLTVHTDLTVCCFVSFRMCVFLYWLCVC